MNKNYPLVELQTKISSAQNVLILLPPNPVFDQVSAALSLSLALQDIGKPVSVVCPTPMTVEFNRLVGVDKVTNKAKGTDLVISLNYPPEQIEKVSYNDDNGRPNVVIQPKTGAPELSEKAVMFSSAGLGADLAITVGVKNPNQLRLPQDSLPQTIINIDNSEGNMNFGQINVIDYSTPSLSEVVLGLTIGLNVPVSQDLAQNILSGIWRSTNGLNDPNLGADSYEAVAICLRAGAQKSQEIFFEKKEENLQLKPKQFQKEKPEEKNEKVEEKKEELPKKPPADWFEPKIFKGSSIS